MARVMEVTTPLGPDVLLFHSMHAREELGRLFEYQIDLLSEKSDIKIDDVLGKGMTVALEVVEGEKPRSFHGYVTRFAQVGTYGRYHRYHAVLRPWLWMLTRTADCRIFQNMSVPDIVKEVFKDHPLAEHSDSLTASYRKWDYCVQYRESDFNFVSRLMEEEGIYYYFKHTPGHHKLILVDSTSLHEPAEGCERLPFIAPDRGARADIDHVSSWDFSREIQSGVFVHRDYDFERPSVNLTTRSVVSRTYSPSDYEVFDYPGHYVQSADGEHYASARIDELATQYEIARGATNARNLTTGCLLTLEDCPRDDQNSEYLVISATHDLEFSAYEGLPEGGSEYRCTFAAMSSKQQFRPRRTTPKPFVQGPQTAVVVGPGGDEIHTDEFGRVKVQFHWDRRGERNEQSSCWMRVSSAWAGNAWGAISIPRIGQEVVVDFLEGDPDQPIVTGRVYNKEQMPPYALPANQTQSGVKSRSSKGAGPDNFNEIRFEDLKGSEQLFIHAEKNQDIEVENDETHWVGHDRKKTIDNDETTLVQGNRTETVKKNESITINGDRTEKIDKNETIAIAKDRKESVGDNETVLIGKDQRLTVDGSRTREVAKDETVTIEGGQTRKVQKDRKTDIGQNDTVKVGKKLVLDAGDQVTIQTGSASIVMKKDGTITIKGKDISLDGSGKISIKASGDVVVKGSKVAQN